jgi:hypothetical protein
MIGTIVLCGMSFTQGFQATTTTTRSPAPSAAGHLHSRRRQTRMRRHAGRGRIILWAEKPKEEEEKAEEVWRPDLDRKSYLWRSMDEKPPDDWEEKLRRKADGSFWADFEPDNKDDLLAQQSIDVDDETEAEAWLDAIQSIAAGEVEFNIEEANRADKMRQMVGWGFDKDGQQHGSKGRVGRYAGVSRSFLL